MESLLEHLSIDDWKVGAVKARLFRQEKELVISLALISLQPRSYFVHLAIIGPLSNVLSCLRKLLYHQAHRLGLHVRSMLEMPRKSVQIAIELLFGVLKGNLSGDCKLPVAGLSYCFNHLCVTICFLTTIKSIINPI